MQILQWLFKRPHDCGSNRVHQHDEVKQRDLVVYNKAISCDDLDCEEDGVENDATFTIVFRRQNSRTCFYSTLQLKHLRNLFKSQSLWRQPGSESRMGCKAETANVVCKVLPICDALSTSSDKDVQKSEGRRAASRVKELLRWAAASKSSRGGSKGWKALYFRHNAKLKAEVDDSSSTPCKMSFKWDVGSCSSSSSMYSPPSTSSNDQVLVKNLAELPVNLQSSELNQDPVLSSTKSEDYIRSEQWITTDSEFVVLEL